MSRRGVKRTRRGVAPRIGRQVPPPLKGAPRLVYLAHVGTADSGGSDRQYAQSAADKVWYICDALNRAGVEVLVVSSARSGRLGYSSGGSFRVTDGTKLRLMPSVSLSGGRLAQRASLLFSELWLLGSLLRTCSAGDSVLVYHSLGYRRVLPILLFVRRVRLILEVEEIYSNVKAMSPRQQKSEWRMVNRADAYLVAAKELASAIGRPHVPSVVVHGAYRSTRPIPVRSARGAVTHVVYAGIIDTHKAGARVALEAASELDSSFHLHILGFGSNHDVASLREAVDAARESTGCSVTYEGMRHGHDFLAFLTTCQVGLSTQSSGGAFNDTSFPSKILTYMSCGLIVVSGPTSVVRNSVLRDAITFYEHETPEAVARAIREAAEQDVDMTATLKRLDAEFVQDLRDLLAGARLSRC